MIDKNKYLIGYDDYGQVVDAGDSIHRIVNPEYFHFAEEIYHICKNNNLNKIGIVNTEIDFESQKLIHEKHNIAYPYEWPADMYKDAVLFHLNLFIELDKYGLTLKDALPSNILFKSTQPVFVDFLSLVKNENLSSLEWLVKGVSFKDRRFAVVEKMLIPYMMIPLLAMSNKNYQQARTMLSQRACNMNGKVPNINEINKRIYNNSILNLLLNKTVKNIFSHDSNKRIVTRLNSYKKEPQFIDYIKDVYELVGDIDVAPSTSSYAGYYSGKKENFDFSERDNWGVKQRNVYNILEKEKPCTVIDIGANTGWFSFLAESTGSNVISMDIDEDCVNSIYRVVKHGGKKIIPLLISFDDLLKQYYGVLNSEPEYADRDFKNTPLFLAPGDRFKGDIVMCLGLIHHLVLGAGHEISFLFQVLSRMTKKSLLIEFVQINDPLIKSEPTFFKNLGRYNENSYNIDMLITEGKKFFKDVEVFDSHPETRKLVLFKN